MGLNNFSDYGSGSSSESISPWDMGDTWEQFHTRLQENLVLDRPKSSSILEIIGKSKFEAKREEFRMNGFDSPYDPETHDTTYGGNQYAGLGPSSGYLRQKSWPAPDATPAAPLPRVVDWLPKQTIPDKIYQKPIEDMEMQEQIHITHESWATLTDEQKRVLVTLPNSILYPLLRHLENWRDQFGVNQKRQELSVECRFCKNNGERASFYRSHALRSRGRVSCPVLRAFVCRRCGAHGDRAHTLKYCPLATAEERKKSTAMMQSLRLASGKRRGASNAPVDVVDDYVVYGSAAATARADAAYFDNAPLDPIWEALERKLML